MSRRKFFYFGHSHVWSIRRAITEFAGDFVDEHVALLCGTNEFPGPLISKHPNGSTIVNAAFVSAFNSVKFDDETHMVLVVQGNNYNALGMFVEGQRFDFVLPKDTGMPLTDDATILPVDSMRRMIQVTNSEFVPFLKRVGKMQSNKPIVVGPPPPVRGEEEIRALMDKRPKTDGKLLISAPFVRLKLWYLQTEFVAAHCLENGAIFINGALENTVDDDGFLLDEYVRDAVHANADYSRLLLQHIEKSS